MENTGILPAIFDLQKRSIHSGTIIAFGKSFELPNLFEGYNGTGTKYLSLFEGRLEDESMVAYDEIFVREVDVTTVENANAGIKAGSKYRLVYVNLNCESGGLVVDKDNAFEFAFCVEKITNGVRKWIEENHMSGMLKKKRYL